MSGILKNLVMANASDTNGVPVAVGDIVKVFHFTAARRRKVYMYKLVADVPGVGIRAVDLGESVTKGISKAHGCPLNAIGDYWVIDGHCKETETGELMCWWERKRTEVG